MSGCCLPGGLIVAGGGGGGTGTGKCNHAAAISALNPGDFASAIRRPIGDGAIYAPATAQTTIDWKTSPDFNINVSNAFGHPYCTSVPTDPMVNVTYWAATGLSGKNLPVSLRVPSGFSTKTDDNDPSHDNEVSIYDPVTGLVHAFMHWHRTSDTVAQAGVHWVFPITDVGYGNPRHSTSASGMCQLWTSLKHDEVDVPGFEFEHCMAVALARKDATKVGGVYVYQQLSRRAVWPAIDTDSSSDAPAYNNGSIDYGSLFGLLPEALGGPSIASLALDEIGQRYARCCLYYGIYVTDGTGDRGNQAQRGDSKITTSAKNSLNIASKKCIPWMRKITNNLAGQTYSGGGSPLAPNCAYNSGAPRK